MANFITLAQNEDYYAFRAKHPTEYINLFFVEGANFDGGYLQIRAYPNNLGNPDFNNPCVLQRDSQGNPINIESDEVYSLQFSFAESLWIGITLKNSNGFADIKIPELVGNTQYFKTNTL